MLEIALITRDALVTAEQCIPRVKAFSASHPTSKKEVDKLGRDTAMIADTR